LINLGQAVGYLIMDATAFNSTLDTALSRVSSLDKETNALTGGLDVISSGLKTTGKILTASVTGPIAAFGASAIKSGADFDSAMARVKAIAGDFGSEQEDAVVRLQEAAEKNKLVYKDMGSYIETAFELVRQKAIQMGNDTKFTAEESADALYYMALAGWGGADMLEGLDGIMALSAASGVELARTSDIVTDALTAFGKEANQAGRFADILAATSANSNTNVDLLGESFKYVAPVAGAYGYSLEDVALALGTMASAGVKGTQAGTGLRQAFKQLTTPTDENAALMEKYGISLYNTDGSVKSLRDSMESWRETFGGLNIELFDTEGNLKTGEQIMEEYGHSLPTTEMEKLNAVASIFGTRALPGVLAIIGSSDKKFKELADDIDGSSESFNGMGDAAYQQAVMLDNLKGDWILFTSALGTAKVIISDMINGPLRKLVQRLRDLVTWFNKASPETQKFVIKMALIAASIGPVIFALGSIVGAASKFIKNLENIHHAITLIKTAFSSFGKSFIGIFKNIGLAFKNFIGAIQTAPNLLTGFKGAISAIISPVGLLVLAIVALVAVFIRLWKTNEEFRNKIKSIWANIVSSLGKSFDKIKAHISKFTEAMKPVLDYAMQMFDVLCNILAPAIEGAFDFIGNILTTAFDALADIIGVIVGILTGDFPYALESATSLLDNLGQLMIAIFNPQYIYEFLNGILEALGTSLPEIIEVAKTLLSVFIEFIGEKANQLLEFVVLAAQTTWDVLLEFVKITANNIYKWFKNIINKAKQFAKDFYNRGREAGSEFYNKIKEFISSIPGKVKEWFDDIVRKAVSFGTRFIEEARIAGTRFKNNIKEHVSSISATVKEKLDNVVNRAKNFIEDFASKATEAGKSFYDNIVEEVNKIPGEVYKIGQNIVEGIWNGIKSMTGWLAGKVGGFINDAINAMKNAAEVESPSKKTEREIGRWLPPGIANGFVKALPASMRVMEDSLNSAITDYNKDIEDFVIGTQFIDPSIVTSGVGLQTISSLYWMLAQYIVQALKEAPIVNNVEIDMEDGDVLLDNERVGRKVAPVVSRVIAMGGG